MRDITRIDPFLKELGEQWKKCPDLRFGQLMENLKIHAGDLFYYEEEAFLNLLRDWIGDGDNI